MMKKGKRVDVEASREEAKARFRLHSLMQDYEELVKETEETRNRLIARKQQKSKLSAEVKFLRRKFKSLISGPSQNAQYVAKPQLQKSEKSKKSRQLMPNMFRNQPKKPDIPKPNKFLQKEKKPRVLEAATPSTSMVLDLNQAIPSGDEDEFAVGGWERQRMERSPDQQFQFEAVQPSCELKLSVCRDGGGGSSRAGKRKMSWQDQVVLRV